MLKHFSVKNPYFGRIIQKKFQNGKQKGTPKKKENNIAEKTLLPYIRLAKALFLPTDFGKIIYIKNIKWFPKT